MASFQDIHVLTLESVNILPYMAEGTLQMRFRILRCSYYPRLSRCSPEKAVAPHSSTLAWKIPWTEDPGRLQSMGSLRVRHDWATSLSFFTFHFYALEKEVATHSSVLAWRIPGTGEPGGLPSMGSHRVGHNWSDLAAAAAAAAVIISLFSKV